MCMKGPEQNIQNKQKKKEEKKTFYKQSAWYNGKVQTLKRYNKNKNS